MYRWICFACILLFGSRPAEAQEFPRDIPGLTVTGRATVRAHADVLYVFARLVPVPGANDDIDGAAAAVVAALTRSHAIDVSAAASVSTGTPTVGRAIAATIADPTIPALAQLTYSITDAVKPYPGTLLQSTRVAPGLAQCVTVETRLYTLAMADARSRAQRLANAAAVTLGTPTVITPGGLPGYAFPCRSSGAIERFDANADALPANGNVEFGLFVNVTYPISAHR